MDRQEQIEFILDHFHQPRNQGKLEPADVTMPGGNPGCGDIITIYLNVDRENDRIASVSFEGEGCTISQAGGSILAEMAPGMTLDEVKALGLPTMIDEMGDDVVKSRVRCATLALGTLQAAVDQYRRDRQREALGVGATPAPLRFEN